MGHIIWVSNKFRMSMSFYISLVWNLYGLHMDFDGSSWYFVIKKSNIINILY